MPSLFFKSISNKKFNELVDKIVDELISGVNNPNDSDEDVEIDSEYFPTVEEATPNIKKGVIASLLGVYEINS